MIKASINLQDLRRRIYIKAKAETSWRFWGLYVHVCKMETLREAYAVAKAQRRRSGNRRSDVRGHRGARRRGVPRADPGRTRSARTYVPLPAPEEGDSQGWRQGPRPLDSCDPGPGGAGSAQAHTGADLRGRLPRRDRLDIVPSGQLMKRSPGWRRPSLSTRLASSTLTCSSYFDTVRHDRLLAKVARRVDDDDVMHLLKMILKATGRCGVPQGGVISPLLSNLYLTEVDRMLERAKEATRWGSTPTSSTPGSPTTW